MKKLNSFKIIGFTHRQLGTEELGRLHIDPSELAPRLGALKVLGLDEIMFLSTCNRVEFLLVSEQDVSASFAEKLFKTAYPHLEAGEREHILSRASFFQGQEALAHLFRVASSLDSLVVGEREIITQVRNAYELCRNKKLTGDLIRLAVQKTIGCAKKVYSQTRIAKNPVSVMSLAYRRLKDLNIKLDAKFLVIGAGITNSTLTKYLKKHGFSNFIVFNRTLARAEKLAADIGGRARPLEQLKDHKDGFDVIVTCTGAGKAIVTKEIYAGLAESDRGRKTVIDLAVPGDLDPQVQALYEVNLIAVSSLQEIAKKNLLEREKELDACEAIIAENLEEFRKDFRQRLVELAMSDVPKKVKEIREAAVNEVFARDIEKLDERSKETLDKVIAYLEKKYISMPMKMAKEILIDEASSR